MSASKSYLPRFRVYFTKYDGDRFVSTSCVVMAADKDDAEAWARTCHGNDINIRTVNALSPFHN